MGQDEIIDKLGKISAEKALGLLTAEKNCATTQPILPQVETMTDNNIITQPLNSKKIMSKNIERINIQDVRDCLDEMRFNSKFIKEDGVIITWFNADEKFGHDIIILFIIEGEDNDWLKMRATAKDYFLPSNNELLKAFLIVNKYNDNRRYATAYVENDAEDGTYQYVFEDNLVADKPVSFEFLKANIEIFCTSAWHFFSTFTTGKDID